MSQSPVSPIARRIVAKCGGAKRVKEITGRSVVTIHKWSQPIEKGGCGGIIPAGPAQALMAAALRGEVPLEPADFFEMPEVRSDA